MATRFGHISATYGGLTNQNRDGDRLYLPEWATDARTAPPQWTAATPAKEEIAAFDESDFLDGEFGTGGRVELFQTDRGGVNSNRASAGSEWFEDVHVIPRSVDLGNILTEQSVPFSLFNGFRYAAKTLTSVTNSAGAGVSFDGLPSLPVDVFQLDTVEFDVVFSTTGDPTIDGSIDVIFGGATIPIPVEGSRIVMFPYRPEAPLEEVLEFLTDVLTKVDGTEQRIAVRKNPRQRFRFVVSVDNDRERQRISNLLFDWQGRVFGLPIHTESTRLTADVAINDTIINVESTASADYRVGDLAIILQDDATFDALNVTAITATTIEFDSPVTHDYDSTDTDVRVMPLRAAFASDVVGRRKEQTRVEEFEIEFTVSRNDADLASTAGFTIHPTDSKVILDGALQGVGLNVYKGGDGQMRRRLAVRDSRAGLFTQSSPWDRSQDQEPLTLFVAEPAKLWAVRRLLHALRGRQVSFYLPTFFPDLTVTGNVVAGGSTLQVQNAGYAQFVDGRAPRNHLRLTTTDGDEYIAAITSATSIDDDDESLSVSVLLKNQAAAGPTWPDNLTVADIARVEFLQKVRLADDDATIEHIDGNGQAMIDLRVVGVFE